MFSSQRILQYGNNDLIGQLSIYHLFRPFTKIKQGAMIVATTIH